MSCISCFVRCCLFAQPSWLLHCEILEGKNQSCIISVSSSIIETSTWWVPNKSFQNYITLIETHIPFRKSVSNSHFPYIIAVFKLPLEKEMVKCSWVSQELYKYMWIEKKRKRKSESDVITTEAISFLDEWRHITHLGIPVRTFSFEYTRWNFIFLQSFESIKDSEYISLATSRNFF